MTANERERIDELRDISRRLDRFNSALKDPIYPGSEMLKITRGSTLGAFHNENAVLAHIAPITSKLKFKDLTTQGLMVGMGVIVVAGGIATGGLALVAVGALASAIGGSELAKTIHIVRNRTLEKTIIDEHRQLTADARQICLDMTQALSAVEAIPTSPQLISAQDALRAQAQKTHDKLESLTLSFRLVSSDLSLSESMKIKYGISRDIETAKASAIKERDLDGESPISKLLESAIATKPGTSGIVADPTDTPGIGNGIDRKNQPPTMGRDAL